MCPGKWLQSPKGRKVDGWVMGVFSGIYVCIRSIVESESPLVLIMNQSKSQSSDLKEIAWFSPGVAGYPFSFQLFPS